MRDQRLLVDLINTFDMTFEKFICVFSSLNSVNSRNLFNLNQIYSADDFMQFFCFSRPFVLPLKFCIVCARFLFRLKLKFAIIRDIRNLKFNCKFNLNCILVS